VAQVGQPVAYDRVQCLRADDLFRRREVGGVDQEAAGLAAAKTAVGADVYFER
jgi:hypothetical protein